MYLSSENLPELCKQLKIAPKKYLGQNFMSDPNMLEFIVRNAQIAPSDIILEVGPGFGSLTELLIRNAKHIYAVEIDKKLFSFLSQKFSGTDNLTLIHADIMKAKLDSIIPPCDFRIISNLPYAISTPFILKIIQSELIPSSMLLLLQEESADRFCAKPGTKSYGSSSVLAQIFFDIKKIRRIPPDIFYPKPDVCSALVHFGKKQINLSVEDKIKLFKIVKTAFSSRRKTLLNNLYQIITEEKIKQFLNHHNLPQNVRPENITPQTYLLLSQFEKIK